MVKFEVDNIYITEDWFCGGFVWYMAISRTDNNIVLQECGQDTTKTYEIYTDTDNNMEYVSFGSYREHEHRMYVVRQ